MCLSAIYSERINSTEIAIEWLARHCGYISIYICATYTMFLYRTSCLVFVTVSQSFLVMHQSRPGWPWTFPSELVDYSLFGLPDISKRYLLVYRLVYIMPLFWPIMLLSYSFWSIPIKLKSIVKRHLLCFSFFPKLLLLQGRSNHFGQSGHGRTGFRGELIICTCAMMHLMWKLLHKPTAAATIVSCSGPSLARQQ